MAVMSRGGLALDNIDSNEVRLQCSSGRFRKVTYQYNMQITPSLTSESSVAQMVRLRCHRVMARVQVLRKKFYFFVFVVRFLLILVLGLVLVLVLGLGLGLVLVLRLGLIVLGLGLVLVLVLALVLGLRLGLGFALL